MYKCICKLSTNNFLTGKMEVLSSSVAITERMVDLKQVLQVEGVFHASHQGISHQIMHYMILHHGYYVVKVDFQIVKNFMKSVHLIMAPDINHRGLQVNCFAHMHIIHIYIRTYMCACSTPVYVYVCLFTGWLRIFQAQVELCMDIRQAESVLLCT